MIHVWYIYLQNWAIYGVNVGKYTSTMDHLGYRVSQLWASAEDGTPSTSRKITRSGVLARSSEGVTMASQVGQSHGDVVSHNAKEEHQPRVPL